MVKTKLFVLLLFHLLHMKYSQKKLFQLLIYVHKNNKLYLRMEHSTGAQSYPKLAEVARMKGVVVTQN